MKKNVSIAAIALLVTGVSVSAQAEEPDYGDHGIKLFQKMDANQDGFLTFTEVEASHRQHHHEMADTNKDGRIHLEEAKAAGKHQDRFHEVDTDDDGHVSFEEGSNVERERFSLADSNGDKKVSWEEYKAHYKEMQQ